MPASTMLRVSRRHSVSINDDRIAKLMKSVVAEQLTGLLLR